MKEIGALFALKTQIEKDRTEERSSRFSFLVSRHPILHFFYRAASAAPLPVRAWASLVYASAVSAPKAGFGDAARIAVEKYANERKQIDLLWAVLSARGFRRWQPKPAILSSLFYFVSRLAADPAGAAKLYRIAKIVCRNHPLFVAMRAMEAVFSYSFAREKLIGKRVKMVVSSSDGNPYGRALMAAARAEGIPLVFISHGAVAETPVRAKISLALLHGQAAADDLIRCRSEIDDFLLLGFRREEGIKRLGRVRRVLIGLGAAPHQKGLRELVGEVRSRFPDAAILVRPHPHAAIAKGPFRKSARQEGWDISSSSRVEEDLARSDLMVAANSTVHLDSLAAGVPSLYAPELDPPSARPLSFLREGLVATWRSSESAADINGHYSSAVYLEMFGRYMSQARTQNEFILEFGRRMDALLAAGKEA